MAHALEMTANGTAAFAYVGKNGLPWHKLGIAVEETLTPQEIAAAAQLTWHLEKVPMFNELGNAIPGFLELRRDSDKRTYDVVGKLYKPVQPDQALEFFAKFVRAGSMKMETAGSLNDGARIFATAKLNTGFTLRGGDHVEGYLLLSSPNRAGESMMVKFTSVRVVCANTLAMATSDGKQTIRINHFAEFNGTAQAQAAKALGLAVEATHEFGERAQALSNVRSTQPDVLRYIHQLTGGKALEAILEGEDVIAKTGKDVIDDLMAAEDFIEKARTVKPDDLNRVGKSILEAITNSPGSELQSARDTWWGALNGVSYVVDHNGNKDADKRYDQAWFGHKARLKDRAFNLAMEYAGLN